MTLGDIANKARALTHTDTVSYTAANLLIDINMWYQKALTMILESQDDSDFDDLRIGTGGSTTTSDYPISTTLLAANQRDYPLPSAGNILKVKRVDVTYDGTNWFRATPFDDGTATFGMGNTTNEDANFIKQAPQYDIKFNSLFIYPLAGASDVSAGASVRVEWSRNVIPFTSADYTTDPNDSLSIPGIDAPFHPMLAYGAALEYGKANNYPQIPAWQQELSDWEVRLRTAYGKKDLDTSLAANYVYDYQFGR